MTTYCKPFKRGQSWRSQEFGANPNNGTNGPGGHSGNDEACDIGTPVHAAGDGVIAWAGTFDNTYIDNLMWLNDFGGNVMVLDCGDAEPSFVYAHLSQFNYGVGDYVSKGEVIALSGNSGSRTTGPHLHVEALAPGYVLNSSSLGRVNPDTYLTEWPEDITTEDEEMALTPQFEPQVREALEIINAKLDAQDKRDSKFDENVRAELAAHRAMLIADKGLTKEEYLDAIKSAVIKVEIGVAE